MLERSNGHTPGVQGATGLRSLVRLVYTQPTKAVRNLLEEAVRIHTAGVHKRCSRQIVRHGLVNMTERSNRRTPGVQGATVPPSLVQLLYTESTGTVRDRFKGGIHIHTGRRILYTWCRRSNGTSQVSNAAVRGPTSESCTDLYTTCTKMPFAPYCLPQPVEHLGAV